MSRLFILMLAVLLPQSLLRLGVFGGDNDEHDRFKTFNGVIDEVVIYNRALTEAEVQERFNLYGP